MNKSTIGDFQIGDEVYHINNLKLILRVVRVSTAVGEITCWCLDPYGQEHEIEFMPEELVKTVNTMLGKIPAP